VANDLQACMIVYPDGGCSEVSEMLFVAVSLPVVAVGLLLIMDFAGLWPSSD
jgi:hypothetical protein